MKKQFILSSVATVAIAIGTIATAHPAAHPASPPPTPDHIWYASLSGGWAYLQDENIGYTDSHFHDGGGATTYYKTGGWNAGLSVGRTLASSLRAEAQITYMYSDMDDKHNEKVTDDSLQTAVWYGANLIYDICTHTKFTPYFGAGIGGLTATTDYKGYMPVDTQIIPGSHTSTALAYQGILGVAYRATPRVHLLAEYRHLASATQLTAIDTGGSTATTGKTYYNNNLLNIGVTVLF